MYSKRNAIIFGSIGLLVLLLLVSSVHVLTHAQTGNDKTASGIINRILTYVNTIAEGIGHFLVFVINMITGIKLSELVVPLGYLGEITLILMAIQILEGAKKVLWLLVLAGWGLIAIRVVLDVLGNSPVK